MTIDPTGLSRGTARARSDAASPLERVLARLDAAADRAGEAGDGAPADDSVLTGCASLDKLLGGGLRAGDLVVIGGDVGSGKSALALAVALRAAQRRSQ